MDLVLECINDADFIAFDTEFTGLSNGEFRMHQYESLQDRYLKIKVNIEEFWLCQLGISTFKYIPEQDVYTAQVFNIYTNPKHRKLGLTVSSMSFLVANGFDMNLLFRDGIDCIREGNVVWNNQNSRYGCFGLSEANENAMAAYEKQILDWIGSNEKSMDILMPSQYVKKTFFGTHGVSRKFKYLEMKADKVNPLLILLKKNPKRLPEYTNPAKEVLAPTEAEVSLLPVIQSLLSKKVPLIGHYMVLDLAFMYDHFIGPLPPTIEEFRKALLDNFPPIYDTKYITKSVLKAVKFIKHTSVEDLFAYCKKRKELNTLVKIVPDERFAISEQAHEAGFDAYMTGYIFITFLKYLKEPIEMKLAKGKVCLQGHYKEYIDLNEPNAEDYCFNNVLKLVSNKFMHISEVSKEMSRFADNFIIQERIDTFFVEFYEADEKIDEILARVNSEESLKAVKFEDRNSI